MRHALFDQESDSRIKMASKEKMEFIEFRNSNSGLFIEFSDFFLERSVVGEEMFSFSPFYQYFLAVLVLPITFSTRSIKFGSCHKESLYTHELSLHCCIHILTVLFDKKTFILNIRASHLYIFTMSGLTQIRIW